MGALDQDAVTKSEAIEKNAEEGEDFLGKTSESSPFDVSFLSAGFGYNKANKRPYRDGAFSIAFAAFTAATVCVGVFAAFKFYNTDFFRVSSARYENSSKTCTVPKGSHDAPSFSNWTAITLSHDALSFSISKALTWLSQTSALNVLTSALNVFLATLILTAPLASSLLWVLCKHTKTAFLAVPFMFIVLLATIVLVPVSCVLQDGCQLDANPYMYATLIVFAYFFLLVMLNNWDNTELSVRIIGTASEVLHQNLGLLFLLPPLSTGLLLYSVPAIFAMFLAYANGKIALSFKVAGLQDVNLEVICMLLDEPCCVWETDRWVPAYLILAIFTTLWGSMVLNEVDLFTISGTISQWYFGAAQNSTRVNLGAVNRSLRHALGPSFGTVCFAALVLAPTRNMSTAAETIRKWGRIARFPYENIRESVLSVPFLDFMTGFTTDFAAITGEGFCSSASMASDLLKRNFLSTIVANSVPRRLLSIFAFISSASYGVLVWGVLALFVENGEHRWQIACGAFVLAFLVLTNCVRIVAQVVDSLYICYAIDKDNGEVSKPMVHDVYALLPRSPDCYIIAPDAKVAFGGFLNRLPDLK